jgi:hypothetical protein
VTPFERYYRSAMGTTGIAARFGKNIRMRNMQVKFPAKFEVEVADSGGAGW